MADDPAEPVPNKRAVLGCLGSLVAGCIVCLVLTVIVIPVIFGVEYRDSSSVWILAGVTDLVTGFAVLPVFIIGQLITYWICRSLGKAPLRSAVIAALVGVLVFLPSVVAIWHSQGAKKVLRAR